MEQIINVAELLKDCPQGMELDCALFNKAVKFDGIDKDNSLYPIRVKIEDKTEWFDKYGCFHSKPYSKCVIYPKGKTTWEGFVPPCKFKVGDKVKSIFNNRQYIITELTDTHYTLVEVIDKFQYTEPIIEDKNWELVPNKFDINTLVPFESKVLVRNSESGFWKPAFWGIYEAEKSNEHQYRNYLTTEGFVRHCIPYNDETKHLVGKTCDCPEYYKTW